jgi:hypothetical protein
VSEKERPERDEPEAAAGHAALTPPGTEEDPTSPEEAIAGRPEEALLESEGEALLPHPEATHPDDRTTALPLDEMALVALEDGDEGVQEGELLRQMEDLFPLVWLAMLMTVCYIALYFAIDQLPNRSNPLPGPDLFF